ncbi:MAG: glycoside hydrolase family 9 protein, partial [Bacteroidota bacterium]
MNKSLFVLLSSLFFILESCETNKSFEPQLSEDILINQLGYPTNVEKQALIKAEAKTFTVRDTSGVVVFEGNTTNRRYWDLSGDTVSVADFSAVNQPGTYRLCIDNDCSHPFEVGNDLYQDLADASLKSYYYARCSYEIEEAFGRQWSRKSGHPDTAVFVHSSAADDTRPEGTILSSPGGWYDAGDYGKYIVNSSITTWTILQSLVFNERYLNQQKLNIPESGNDLPDVLDEALVNLRWMMTMQDPNDGGVYHKLTTKDFDGFIMPETTVDPRLVIQKSTSATLDYAATIASAARIVGSYGLSDLSAKMQSSSLAAWEWALDNPEEYYIQPEDITTGAYPDSVYADEWFWAASELYLLTGDEAFKSVLLENYQKPITPKWDLVHTLGMISLITSDKKSEFESMSSDFLAYADEMLDKESTSPYLISMNEFAWGSNSDVANDGMLKLVAYHLAEDVKYIASARNDLHYILGRNTTGYS